jgi:hypothetical protein
VLAIREGGHFAMLKAPHEFNALLARAIGLLAGGRTGT